MTKRQTTVLAVAAALIVLAIVGGFIWLLGAQTGHFLWSMARISLISGPVAIVLGAVVGFVILRIMGRDYLDISLLSGFGVAVLTFIVGQAFVVSYAIPHSMAQTTQVEEAEDLSFRQRVPFDVASAVSNRNLGATTGDASGTVKALPAEGENGTYTTTVIRRGMFKGYESTQTMTAPLYGSTGAQNVSFCEFSDDAELRLGGLAPKNNLKRAIQWKTSPSTLIDSNDALVRCEDGTPMVYVPTTQLDSNVFLPKRVPGPVAVYNGSTGELSIEEELETDLPLYPKSIAERQRESLTRSGSAADWFFRRSGFEDTSNDGDDPNGENRAEFGLADESGENQYFVTPLTARGSSSSIVALGTVDAAGELKAGELRPYQVHTYPKGESRQANSAVASRITGEVLSGYRASGLKVFEVVPSEDNTWTATVGKEQSVLYRAVINPDGSIELFDNQGNTVAGEGQEPEEGSELKADKPLEDMSVDELKQLGDDILEELAARASTE